MSRLFLIFTLSLALLSGQTGLAFGQELRVFRIGTGGVAGTYFPVGGLLADVISNPPGARPCDLGGSCGVEGLVAIAQSSDGSVANIRGMVDGTLESGLVQSDIAFSSRSDEGQASREESDHALRLIASLYVESVQLVVSTASGISSVGDLRGKRVSLDDAGSGTQVNAKLILESHGIGEGDIEPIYEKSAQAGRMMRAGELDAFFIVAGTPTLSVAELAEENVATLVPLDTPEIDRLLDDYPFFSRNIIAAGTYDGVETTPTLGVLAQWVTTAGLDEELVYQITKALWHPNARRLLDHGHVKARAITLATALDGAGIPLHAGAERYYREVGILE